MKTLFASVLAGLSAVALLAVGVQSAYAAPATSSYIVMFAPGTDRALEVANARAQGLQVSRVFADAFSGMVVSLTPAQATAFAQKPTTAVIEADTRVTASDTQVAPTWGLDRVDQRSLPLDSAYSHVSSPGVGVRAYVIDTGILASQADLSGRVQAGWSAIGATTDTTDCNGHGTHVAGTLAGTTYGVAKAANVVPVRVLDCAGSGTMSGVIAGIDWTIANHTAGVPAVANLSLGGGISSTLDTAIQSLNNDGVVTVVAAGNSSADACTSSPARAPSALTVAASDSTDAQASFSNFGSCVDLYGPGVGITSSWYTSTTATASLSGTSMAAPHVAGVAAVTLGTQPTLTPAQVSSTILGNATTNVIRNATTGTPNKLVFNPSASTPTTVPATVPAAPTAVTATAVAGKAANVAWTPGANGGSVVTKYSVSVWLSGKVVKIVTVSGTATTVKVTGLTAGKKYNFSVTATNAVGTSARSVLSNTITALR